MKLTGYALIAWGQWLAGRGFAVPLADMALATALVFQTSGVPRAISVATVRATREAWASSASRLPVLSGLRSPCVEKVDGHAIPRVRPAR